MMRSYSEILEIDWEIRTLFDDLSSFREDEDNVLQFLFGIRVFECFLEDCYVTFEHFDTIEIATTANFDFQWKTNAELIENSIVFPSNNVVGKRLFIHKSCEEISKCFENLIHTYLVIFEKPY